MAHMLEVVDGKAKMAYVGEPPWHGLGKKCRPDLTPEQFCKEAGADFEVIKIPSYVYHEKKRYPTGDASLFRSDTKTILSNVSEDWETCQNIDAFKFFDEWVIGGDMEMHTAGVLKDGQIVWALAKIKEGFSLFRGDDIESYMLFTNPHQYGQSIDVRSTLIRVVCWNTITLALSQKGDTMVRLNHSKPFDADKCKELLGVASLKMGKFKDIAKFLGSKQFSDETVKEYFADVFPLSGANLKKKELSRNANHALEVLDTQPGAKYARGSWWQAYNAVTFMTDHELGHNADSRLTSAWYGPGRQRKIDALATAHKYAEAA